MLALWGALKSVVYQGADDAKKTKVLAVATGLYGYGIGDMAQSIGCTVDVVGMEYDETYTDEFLKRVEARVHATQPDVVTAGKSPIERDNVIANTLSDDQCTAKRRLAR